MSSRFEFHINIANESTIMMDYEPQVDKYGEEETSDFRLRSDLEEEMEYFESEGKDMLGQILENGKVIAEVSYTAAENDYNTI